MNTLEVRLFGGVGVRLNGHPVRSFPTRWAEGLLAYLAITKGQPIHRDVLAARFWPEELDSRARKGLRNALWRVRATIEPDGTPPGSFLVVAGRNVCLRKESVWLDVEEFDGRMALLRREVEDRTRAGNLEACVGLYRGDFMDGHDYQWCLFERERLRIAHLLALEHLLDWYVERREWHQAIQAGREILRHDPFREHVHRCLMICHQLMGNRPLAIRQFRECVRLLDEEMGLAPMEATQDLHREIMAETVGHKSEPNLFPMVPGHQRSGEGSGAPGRIGRAPDEKRPSLGKPDSTVAGDIPGFKPDQRPFQFFC